MQPKTNYEGLYIVVHILAFLSVITLVFHFVSVIFEAVNIAYPVLNRYTDVDSSYDDIRTSLSFLIVVFPLFVGLSHLVQKGYAEYPTIRDNFLRKGVVYVSIIATILTIIGTLISSVYYFLGGEFTLPFALKCLALLVVSLLVGAYYYLEFKGSDTSHIKLRLLGGGAALAIIVAISWCIHVTGTPGEIRAKKNDVVRIGDLQGIQNQLVSYWQTNGSLPAKTEELATSVSYFELPLDPVTNTMYTYKIVTQSERVASATRSNRYATTDAVFEICANFETARTAVGAVSQSPGKDFSVPVMTSTGVSAYYADGSEYGGSIGQVKWNHPEGAHCFARLLSEKTDGTMRAW